MRDDREHNRSRMPQTAALVDALREQGMGPAWIRATENGQTIEAGRRTEDRKVPPIPGLPAK